MTVKRNAERQEAVYGDLMVAGRSLMKGDENEISACLTSFKYQKDQMQVDSPPFSVKFCDRLHFIHEQGRLISFWSKE